MRRKRDAGYASTRATSFSTIDSFIRNVSNSWLNTRTMSYFAYSMVAVGNGARVGPGCCDAFSRHEAQRLAQHLGEVVPHQQRFVLVDRQPGLPFARGASVMLDAALGDVVARDQRLELLVEPEPRILQVHRIDRVRRDRHDQALAHDFLFAREADDAGQRRRRWPPFMPSRSTK